MPQLPSGRHVAVDPAPLVKMVEEVSSGKSVASWPIHAIEERHQLLRHFALVYLEPSGKDSMPQLRDDAKTPPEGLTPVPTGLNVLAPFKDDSGWSEADKRAWAEFLTGERMENMLEDWWPQILKLQELLLEDGNLVQRVEAAAWRTGCHWLQDEELNGPQAIPSKYVNKASNSDRDGK